jgi:hypothetical protein
MIEFPAQVERLLSPARETALREAVRWAGQGGDFKAEQPTTQRILEVAGTFEAWLTREEDPRDE